MKCIGLWYGGSNYACPDPENDAEAFDSLKDAADALWRRADFDPFYPCVDEGATEMHVYFREYSNDGPDRIIRLGPRGGVRIERA